MTVTFQLGQQEQTRPVLTGQLLCPSSTKFIPALEFFFSFSFSILGKRERNRETGTPDSLHPAIHP